MRLFISTIRSNQMILGVGLGGPAPVTTFMVGYGILQNISEQLPLLQFSRNCSLFFPPCNQSVNIQLMYCSDSASAL